MDDMVHLPRGRAVALGGCSDRRRQVCAGCIRDLVRQATQPSLDISGRMLMRRSDYDPHGPAGPTAFWKASDSETARNTLHEVLPSDFFIAYTTLAGMDDSDDDGELDETNLMELEWEEADWEEDDFDGMSLGEQIASEIPGLLQDAQMDVASLSPATEDTGV